MRDKYRNRMAPNVMTREIVQKPEEIAKPSERKPVEMVPVEVLCKKCPHCGCARPGQMKEERNGVGGKYSWCSACGHTIGEKNGLTWVVR